MFTGVFLLHIYYFSVCLTSNKLYWIEGRRLYSILYVGELDRQQVDWIPLWLSVVQEAPCPLSIHDPLVIQDPA